MTYRLVVSEIEGVRNPKVFVAKSDRRRQHEFTTRYEDEAAEWKTRAGVERFRADRSENNWKVEEVGA